VSTTSLPHPLYTPTLRLKHSPEKAVVFPCFSPLLLMETSYALLVTHLASGTYLFSLI
jgi:hypothetical protein